MIGYGVIYEQRPEWSEGASSEKSILEGVKAGTKTQVFDEEYDLCKELNFILTEFWSGKL